MASFKWTVSCILSIFAYTSGNVAIQTLCQEGYPSNSQHLPTCHQAANLCSKRRSGNEAWQLPETCATHPVTFREVVPFHHFGGLYWHCFTFCWFHGVATVFCGLKRLKEHVVLSVSVENLRKLTHDHTRKTKVKQNWPFQTQRSFKTNPTTIQLRTPYSSSSSSCSSPPSIIMIMIITIIMIYHHHHLKPSDLFSRIIPRDIQHPLRLLRLGHWQEVNLKWDLEPGNGTTRWERRNIDPNHQFWGVPCLFPGGVTDAPMNRTSTLSQMVLQVHHVTSLQRY